MAMQVVTIATSPWFVTPKRVENEGQFHNRENRNHRQLPHSFYQRTSGWHTLRARSVKANFAGRLTLWAFTDNISPLVPLKTATGFIEIILQNHRARQANFGALARQLGERRGLVLDIDDGNTASREPIIC